MFLDANRKNKIDDVLLVPNKSRDLLGTPFLASLSLAISYFGYLCTRLSCALGIVLFFCLACERGFNRLNNK